VLVVKVVRRTHHYSIEVFDREKFSIILGPKRDIKATLDSLHLLLARPAYGNHFHIRKAFQNRNVVLNCPMAGTDNSHSYARQALLLLWSPQKLEQREF